MKTHLVDAIVSKAQLHTPSDDNEDEDSTSNAPGTNDSTEDISIPAPMNSKKR